jgi:hypothetical protein
MWAFWLLDEHDEMMRTVSALMIVNRSILGVVILLRPPAAGFTP